ncbi:MAG: NADH-quinone oxidoreductase subunit H [Leptospiraceae bacterium]|nr:NADH-quinone oxidoreductase subunit H [Leptospiraceae bacterium]MCP5493424.1 NADH-quinone oxidoreductase subunit H [Leptospiraceae bacterium]
MDILNTMILVAMFVLFPLVAGGIIRKVRARAQGRKGPPVFQNVYDMLRMFQKTPVDGPNSGIFAEISPVTALFSGFVIWTIVVFEWTPYIMIPFFLAMQRIAMVTFAMETGTSFGGLGTSREILLSISSEPIIILIILVAHSHMELSFTIVGVILGLLFLGASTVAILAELAKPPFDDPRTHLELTMVHEAMLLEASGRTMALFEMAYQLKIATFLVFLLRLAVEHSKFLSNIEIPIYIENLFTFGGAIFMAIIIGYWESVSVRRKWTWVPEIMGMTFLFILVMGTLVKLN